MKKLSLILLLFLILFTGCKSKKKQPFPTIPAKESIVSKLEYYDFSFVSNNVNYRIVKSQDGLLYSVSKGNDSQNNYLYITSDDSWYVLDVLNKRKIIYDSSFSVDVIENIVPNMVSSYTKKVNDSYSFEKDLLYKDYLITSFNSSNYTYYVEESSQFCVCAFSNSASFSISKYRLEADLKPLIEFKTYNSDGSLPWPNHPLLNNIDPIEYGKLLNATQEENEIILEYSLNSINLYEQIVLDFENLGFETINDFKSDSYYKYSGKKDITVEIDYDVSSKQMTIVFKG